LQSHQQRRAQSRREGLTVTAAGTGEGSQSSRGGLAAAGAGAGGRHGQAGHLFPRVQASRASLPPRAALQGDAFHAKVGLGDAIFDSVMAAMTPKLSPRQDAKASPPRRRLKT
jgi:hypothetical protein